MDCTYPSSGGPEQLRAAITRIREDAEKAVREGHTEIFLTDENVNEDHVGMAMILAAAAVHTHLVHKGLRSYASINVRSARSEEHTSELQSLMRISYAVFCLTKKKQQNSNKEKTT